MRVIDLYNMFIRVNRNTLILVYDDMKDFHEFNNPITYGSFNEINSEIKSSRVLLFDYDNSDRLRVLIRKIAE